MAQWQPPAQRPYLYTTPAELADMRRRIAAGEDRVCASLAALREQARVAATQELPVFDHAFAVPLQFEGWLGAYTEVTRQGYWLHRATEPALAAALLYNLADDPAALAACRRVLLHFASGYIFDIEHYDAAMNDAVFGIPLLYAYDLTFTHYNVLERRLVERLLADMAGHILAGDKFWGKNHIGGDYNNHYAFHKLGLLSYGLHANRREYIDYCFQPPFGLHELLAHGLRDDGLSLESSLSYHFAIAMPILLAGRSLRLAGYPLDFLAVPADGGRSWRDLYTSILNLLQPDGILPVIGDNYGNLPALPYDQYALACHLWPDARLAWALGRAPQEDDWLGAITRLLPAPADTEGQAPHPVTRLWPEHGYALLVREGQQGYFSASTAACFINYGYSGIHGHQDKLHWQLTALGVRWLTDAEGVPSPERHAMTAHINTAWNSRAWAHNTLVVDDKSQAGIGANLALEVFDADARCITLRDDGKLYPGVTQRRTVTLGERTLSDRLHVSCADEHGLSYFLHLDKGVELALPADAVAQADAGEAPYAAWLREVVRLPLPAEGLTLVARKDGKQIQLTLGCSAPAELWSGVSPANEDWQPPHFRALWLRTRGKAAGFSLDVTW